MKKFTAVLAVLALTLVASVAMAEVTVSGSVDIRSLKLNNTSDYSDKAATSDRQNTTQERIRVNIDGKHDNVKGRITFENDWEVWGTEQNITNGNLLNPPSTGTETMGVEARQGQPVNGGKTFGIREAWIDFTIPGAQPAHVKVGHQFLQLGNGWFFRSMKYGSDAWLVGLPGKNTIAFVDVKVGEGLTTQSDDIDAYVLLDNFKIDDTKTVGAYFARVNDRRGGFLGGTEANLDNIGLWFNGKLGPVNLQAEVDFQMGKAKGAGNTGGDVKFKGTQIVFQGNMAAGPAKINATIAQGSGNDLASTADEVKAYVPVLDSDPHYTVVYEYFAKTACAIGDDGTNVLYAKNTGFCNTTALNIGGSMDVAKWLNVSLDFWMLKAVEKVSIGNTALTNTNLSDKIGNEIDLVLRFKLYDQLTWNWQIARLMPGKAYDKAGGVAADDMDAIQGILSYKF